MSTSTATVEELIRSLYRLGLVQRSIARHALEELGSQGFVALAAINRHGPVRVSDVAQRLHVDLSVASRQIAALGAAGYVRREPDPDDRRAHLVTVTDQGSRVLRDSHRRMVEAFAGALTGWADDEVAALAAGLDRLREDFLSTLVASAPTPTSASDPQQENRS
jgi:DNA-binding MarR family transcriptional regulator